LAYRKPPRSGNEINGLDVPTRQPAQQVFHGSGSEKLDWSAMDRVFPMLNNWRCVWQAVRNRWQLRRADGPVAVARLAVDDPASMAADIKARTKRWGAGIVGIAPVTEDALYAGKQTPHPTAICIGAPMKREEMAYAPQARAGTEVMRSYWQVGRIAVTLAAHIRSLGWPAAAYASGSGNDVLHIPLAINAGLGQLGKHGSIISTEYGSNFRISVVLTDLPLALDAPVDIAVDDLCLRCQRCVDKWYVDFDKCTPYFSKTYGCAICIEVCPWSEPGRGPIIAQKLLAKRANQRPTAKLDAEA